MIVLGWVLTIVGVLFIGAVLVGLTILDWKAMTFAVFGILVIAGMCWGLQLIGVIH